MKIVYVITRSDAVGGATIHVRDLALAMRQRGHEVLVLVGGEGVVTEMFTRAGVPYQPLEFLRRPIDPLHDLRALRELTACLRELRPALVSSHTAKAGWLARAACARLGIPALYTPHGLSVGDRISATRGRLFGLAERIAARGPLPIVCVCDHERRLALDANIAPAERLPVIYNGVREIPPELRADPARSPVTLVSVARFAAPKDHATLLRALAALRAENWELELVGDGPSQEKIRRLADELSIGPRVHMTGYHPDPAPALARARIFVLSSHSEAFPRSILEAMRAGLPVVASDVGGVPEAVEHGVTGMLVAPSNPAALAEALGSLIVDAPARARLGARARAAYEARFRLDRMVEETAALYESIRSY